MARLWFLAFSFIFLCVASPTSGYAQIFRVDYGSKKTSGQIKNGQVTATIEHQRRINSDGSNVVQPVVNVLVGDLPVGSMSTANSFPSEGGIPRLDGGIHLLNASS